MPSLVEASSGDPVRPCQATGVEGGLWCEDDHAPMIDALVVQTAEVEMEGTGPKADMDMEAKSAVETGGVDAEGAVPPGVERAATEGSAEGATAEEAAAEGAAAEGAATEGAAMEGAATEGVAERVAEGATPAIFAFSAAGAMGGTGEVSREASHTRPEPETASASGVAAAAPVATRPLETGALQGRLVLVPQRVYPGCAARLPPFAQTARVPRD